MDADHDEMPVPMEVADRCEHAGVGKACRACREREKLRAQTSAVLDGDDVADRRDLAPRLADVRADIEAAVADFHRIFLVPYKLPPNLELACRALSLAVALATRHAAAREALVDVEPFSPQVVLGALDGTALR